MFSPERNSHAPRPTHQLTHGIPPTPPCTCCAPLQDYATLQHMMREVQQNIAWRQANIGAMTQEVARLRSQLGSAEAAAGAAPSQQGQRAPAASPSASPAAARSGSQAPAPIQQSAAQYGLSVAAVVFLGGVLLPSWEDKLGLGGGLRLGSAPFLGGLLRSSSRCCYPTLLHTTVVFGP